MHRYKAEIWITKDTCIVMDVLSRSDMEDCVRDDLILFNNAIEILVTKAD